MLKGRKGRGREKVESKRDEKKEEISEREKTVAEIEVYMEKSTKI